MKIAEIRFVPAPHDLRARGLRGWASCEVDGQWRFDSLAVRRTADGSRYYLSFPARNDRGVERPYMHPVDDATRVAIEDAVIGELSRQGVLP